MAKRWAFLFAVVSSIACGGSVDSSSECSSDGGHGDSAVGADAAADGGPVVPEAASDAQDSASDAPIAVDAAEAGPFDPCSVGPAFVIAPYPQFAPKSGVACQKNVALLGIGLDCPGIEVKFGDTPAVVLGSFTSPAAALDTSLQRLRVQVPVLPQDAGTGLQISATSRSGLSQTSTEYFFYQGSDPSCVCVDSVDAGPDAGGCW
jgi:hypothetical protein